MKFILRVVGIVVLLAIVSRMPMGHLGASYLRLVTFLFTLAFGIAFLVRGR
jgi:hypothetical protein